MTFPVVKYFECHPYLLATCATQFMGLHLTLRAPAATLHNLSLSHPLLDSRAPRSASSCEPPTANFSDPHPRPLHPAWGLSVCITAPLTSCSPPRPPSWSKASLQLNKLQRHTNCALRKPIISRGTLKPPTCILHVSPSAMEKKLTPLFLP